MVSLAGGCGGARRRGREVGQRGKIAACGAGARRKAEGRLSVVAEAVEELRLDGICCSMPQLSHAGAAVGWKREQRRGGGSSGPTAQRRGRGGTAGARSASARAQPDTGSPLGLPAHAQPLACCCHACSLRTCRLFLRTLLRATDPFPTGAHAQSVTCCSYRTPHTAPLPAGTS